MLTTRRLTRHASTSIVLLALLSLALLSPVAAASGGDAELWANGQDTNRIFILNGRSLAGVITLPAGTGPHVTTFSPSGAYAYVAGITSGDLVVIDAGDRTVASVIDLGGPGVHQAQPSPDGSFLLVSQTAARQLIKVAADESAGAWSETARVTLGAGPVCTLFVPGTDKAYVTLATGDLLVVDTGTLGVTGLVDIAGQARCNLTWSKDSATVYLTSENGTDGFLYSLDPATDHATLLATFPGARDLHTPAPSPNGKQLYIAGRGNDLFYTVSLATLDVSSFEIGTPGVADQPDGLVVIGNNAYVNLKRTGRMAVVGIRQQAIDYIDLANPSANALLNVVRRP